MDIPFVRFAFPSLILYLFYWALIVNPWVEDVENDVKSAAVLSIEQTQALLVRNKELLAAGKFEEALGPTQQLHKAFPENHIYIGQLADLYHSLERPREESEMWEQYMQYAPLPIEGCPQIAFAYQKQSRAKDALKAFERCLAIDPQNSDSLFYMAHALEMDQQFGRSAELYRRGVLGSPNYPDLAIGLARVQYRLGQVAEARKSILVILKKSPDNVDALLVAGLACWGSGDRGAAIRYLEHGIKLSPNYKDLRTVLARVRRDAGGAS